MQFEFDTDFHSEIESSFGELYDLPDHFAEDDSYSEEEFNSFLRSQVTQ